MADKAIEIRNLSKKYNIAEIQQKHETLAATLIDGLKRPLRRARNLLRGNQTGAAELNKVFWALQDISLDVEEGETIGIIGRNGAGKSTLLKILSRITDPSGGYVEISGRVGSLLEVGTGFNDELSGRENVYLNGSILGMANSEITRKFDEIVDFAGVWEFIDTPVKHYSSGMKVRLAFAVAAHLEPDILLIDEVLAVGDYAFQNKSLNKLLEITKSGRTVLFVSHQLDMVRTICERVVLLNEGRIEMIGSTDEVLDYYEKSFEDIWEAKSSFSCIVEEERPFQLLSGRILNVEGKECSRFDMFDPITIEYEYIIRTPTIGLAIVSALYRNDNLLFLTWDVDKQPTLLESRIPGRYSTCFTIQAPLLKEGYYKIDAIMNMINTRAHKRHKLEDSLRFEIVSSSKSPELYSYSQNQPGRIALELPWEIEKR